MSILSQILLSTTLVSGIALLTAVLLSTFPRFLQKLTPFLVTLAAGSMMSVSFLHLIPESVEHLSPTTVFGLVLISFFSFFIVERLFHVGHRHREMDHCNDHTFGWLNIFTDALHNFVDGVLLGSTFLVNPALGWLTTFAVITEEVPQELGDFGVLLFSGFSRRRALLANSLTAVSAIFGGLLAYFLGTEFTFIAHWLIPITAGGFLYLASIDLIPEIYLHWKTRSVWPIVLVFIVGLAILPVTEKLTEPWLGELHHEEEQIFLTPTREQ